MASVTRIVRSKAPMKACRHFSTQANSVFFPAESISSSNHPGGRSSVSGVVATVFGSTGFVGRYVVNNLGRIGSQVIVPYRGDGMNTRHLKLAGDVGQIVPIPFNVMDEASVSQSLIKSNVVVNALGSQTETTRFSYDDVNVKIPFRLAEQAKLNGVERFIHISCIGADLNSSSKYFRSMAEGELAVKYHFPDATILRAAPIFGLEDRLVNYYAKLARYYWAIPTVFDGNTKIQPVYVGDVSRAVLGAINYYDSVGQTYNLAGPQIFTHFELIDLTVRHLKFENVSTLNMPEGIARLYGRFMAGQRPFLNPSPTARQFFPYLPFVGAWLDRLRFPGVFHEDLVDRLKYDLILPEGADVKTLRDLNVLPTPLQAQLPLITAQWRRYDSEKGSRFEDADKRGTATKPLI